MLLRRRWRLGEREKGRRETFGLKTGGDGESVVFKDIVPFCPKSVRIRDVLIAVDFHGKRQLANFAPVLGRKFGLMSKEASILSHKSSARVDPDNRLEDVKAIILDELYFMNDSL